MVQSTNQSKNYQGVMPIGRRPLLERGICTFEPCHPDQVIQSLFRLVWLWHLVWGEEKRPFESDKRDQVVPIVYWFEDGSLSSSRARVRIPVGTPSMEDIATARGLALKTSTAVMNRWGIDTFYLLPS